LVGFDLRGDGFGMFNEKKEQFFTVEMKRALYGGGRWWV